ncbi:NAD-dependent succinate-semialdehyde dehydrogenase [Actinotignum timonense]|uniref:NAD-dependent succinate-semialdehyde dehydrogenase n=1 Tax=Actinotignum TaxID=1653174 RepID=UPI00254A0064|nr:NAD-dependent succinate-semialdehyde dehydrogenase [Actinotignum timonense]MDK6591234.1 NAD-dependent succinate-semialdehyde dehydrogenase [Actinotignum timonense]MDK6628694.1 NAD-dependent succinate-semialdehyde dehydrogenase [Actinotignum timonense]
MAYKTVSPYTGETLKEYPTATDEEVKKAVDVAHNAFLAWRETSYEQRAQVLQKAADLLRERRTEYASIITKEMGKVIGEAEAEVDICIAMFEDYVRNGEKYLATRTLPSDKYGKDSVQLLFQPLGVLFMVEPWNFPYYQIVRVAAPQLFAGNTLILKHASIVPESAATFVEIFREAGLPEGCFQNLYLSHDQSEIVLADPRVRGVALTGSEVAGAAIAQLAGKYIKKSTLELGGADAFIVLEDADIDKTVAWAVTGRHWNAGQVCCSSKRMIVVDAVYEEFLAKYREGVKQLKAGDPMDRETTLAPLSSAAAKRDLAKQLEEAIAEGAKAEEAGIELPEHGNFFQPTILTDIPAGAKCRYTEFFGPVSQIYRVKDEEEAITLANDSPYGLGGSVFTEDLERGKKVAARLDTGMVYLNHPTAVAADIPFGGVKNSGYGHELIDLGIHEFVNIKVVANSPIDGEF